MTNNATTALKCILMMMIFKANCFVPLSPKSRSLPSSSSSMSPPSRSSSNNWMSMSMSNVPFNTGEYSISRSFIPSQGEQTEKIEEPCTLSYKVARPMAISSTKTAPIVVLHGGPSLPSDYLYPLVDVVPYRSIIFYDQIGCGRSSQPQDVNAYSIDKAVDDLEFFLKKKGIRRFHLYGQSFGGILAFEYIKRVSERNMKVYNEGCLSVILSSAPTSVKLFEEEANRLTRVLDESENNDGLDAEERFRQTHQCRTPTLPPALGDSYARAGYVWRGTDAISDYVAEPPSDEAERMPSALVLRGEHDIVTEACLERWGSLFNHRFVRTKTLEGCSHHGLLERGAYYGDIVESFFAEKD